MIKYAILVLAALSSVALGHESIYDKPGYHFRMERRLGHFKDEPFVDLYKQYATAFDAPNYPNRPADDYRNYRPSADVCRTFFGKFQSNGFKLGDLHNLIELDACLGYVVDGVYKEDPDASESQKDYFDHITEEVKSVYKTDMGTYDTQSKSCVADLLLNTVLARKQFPDKNCNNHMVQNYIQFAECQKDTPLSSFKGLDPYVRIIYDLLQERMRECMDAEVSAIEEAVRTRFGSQYFQRFAAKASWKDQRKQQGSRMWPSEVKDLLAAVQNTKGEISLREVHQLLADVQRGDEKIQRIFFDNIAQFADRKIKPTNKPAKKGSTASTDPNGQKRYKSLIDKTCNPFRSSDSEKDYDYATAFIRMVQLLNHEEIFGIAKHEFAKKFVTHTYESAPVYFSVSACNMLTFTEGFFKHSPEGKPHYEVHFVPNNERMVKWPTADYI